MFRKPKNVVGLDIGSSAVKAVEIKSAGKGYRVVAFGHEPVPVDSIVDGAIIDAGAVADAIRRVFDGKKGFKTKEVCASLSGNAVIVKKITLPVMTPSELDDSIAWEAEQYIPFDIQDVNLDYQILDPGTGPDSNGSMEVLLVAAKKKRSATTPRSSHRRDGRPLSSMSMRSRCRTHTKPISVSTRVKSWC